MREETELEQKISIEELEEEELDHRLSKAEKKARIRELKQNYGPDWKKALSWIKTLKVDKEASRNMYGDFSSLKKYNDPGAFRR